MNSGREALSSVPMDPPPTVVVTLDGTNVAAKLARLGALRVRLRLAVGRFQRVSGTATPVALYPNVASPSVVYQLSGSARSYAEGHLLPAPIGVPNAIARFLGMAAGCSPSVGAVALVGEDSMLARIPAITATLARMPKSPTQLSVVEVCTTRRLYLVFAQATDRPEWVVQFCQKAELSKLDSALRVLHALLPDMVADAVAFRQWQGDTWAHVQRGLPGLPWVRFSAALGADVHEWLALRARALLALSRFQRAVSTIADWNHELDLGRELSDQLAWYRAGHTPDAKVIAQGEKSARALSALGRVRSQWQHGDYCFNNMLVSPDRIGLIDFEEFGQTSMPLHDEFSLAFSTHDFLQRHQDAPSLSELLRDCFVSGRGKWGFDFTSLGGLLLHHLLWRLRQCDVRPQRKAMGVVLRRQLIQLVDDAGLRITT